MEDGIKSSPELAPKSRPAKPVPALTSFDVQFDHYIADGWRVTSDGPTGVQFAKNTWSLVDAIGLVVGLVTIYVYGIGVLIMVAAVLDHCLNPKMVFIKRD